MGLVGIIFILIHKQKPEKILIFATCLPVPDAAASPGRRWYMNECDSVIRAESSQ